MPTSIPLPVIANVYRVAFRWHDAATGQRAVNVGHFEMAAATAADVKTALDAHVTAAMWGVQEANAVVYELDIIKLDGTSATVSFPVSGAKWTGSGGAGDFAPNVANVIKLQTGLRGRANRGRLFLPFVAEGNTTAGALGGTQVTAGQAAWDAFYTAMNAALCFPVVASYDRKHSGAAAHRNYVVKFVYEAETATQRRRQQRNR